jgi:hypothetical protein
MLRLAGGSGFPDTLMTQEPVANGEYSNVIGEFKGSGINNLSEEDMSTLTHKIEEMLLKEADRVPSGPPAPTRGGTAGQRHSVVH